MTNKEIIEKLKELQREIDSMNEADVDYIFNKYNYEDTESGYLLSGFEHGLQEAIDLLGGR